MTVGDIVERARVSRRTSREHILSGRVRPPAQAGGAP
ncbi:MAG: hypothetical protein JWM18_3451 [Chloroflexi bacterium]|jgi:hypothetical protein|nr:hypothetical protein [Chloroflexota bacterium]